MITVYFSNKLELLANEFFKLFSNHPLYNPLQSEIILVENVVMSEWIHMELAKKFGISANITFFFPLNFIWDILNKSLWNIFPENYISRPVMIWKFMKILDKVNSIFYDDMDLYIIKHYLCNDIDKRKCFQLSKKLVDLFIQYFIYRSDWLNQWKFGGKVHGLNSNIQNWQCVLWKLFLQEIHNDNKSFSKVLGNIYIKLCDVLNTNTQKISFLPKRIFIYGIVSLTPVLVDILHALGKYIDIYIFLINPCSLYIQKNTNFNVITNIDNKYCCESFLYKKSHTLFDKQVFLLYSKKKIP